MLAADWNTALNSNGCSQGSCLLKARKIPITTMIDRDRARADRADPALEPPHDDLRVNVPSRSRPPSSSPSSWTSARPSRVPWLPGMFPITACPPCRLVARLALARLTRTQRCSGRSWREGSSSRRWMGRGPRHSPEPRTGALAVRTDRSDDRHEAKPRAVRVTLAQEVAQRCGTQAEVVADRLRRRQGPHGRVERVDVLVRSVIAIGATGSWARRWRERRNPLSWLFNATERPTDGHARREGVGEWRRRKREGRRSRLELVEELLRYSRRTGSPSGTHRLRYQARWDRA